MNSGKPHIQIIGLSHLHILLALFLLFSEKQKTELYLERDTAFDRDCGVFVIVILFDM